MDKDLRKRYEEDFKPNFNKKDFSKALQVYKDFPEMKILLTAKEKARMIYLTDFRKAYNRSDYSEANSISCDNRLVRELLKSHESKKIKEYVWTGESAWNP